MGCAILLKVDPKLVYLAKAIKPDFLGWILGREKKTKGKKKKKCWAKVLLEFSNSLFKYNLQKKSI